MSDLLAVYEAAIRLSEWSSQEYALSSDGENRDEDQASVLAFCLEELGQRNPDGQEPITPEWVATVAPRYWEAGEEYCWPTLGLRYAVNLRNPSPAARELWYFDGIRGQDPSNPRPIPLRTRDDLRTLLRLLGHASHERPDTVRTQQNSAGA